MINLNEHLVAVSKLVRNYSEVKDLVNNKKFLTVLANNKPELVLCSLDFFNRLMELLDQYERSEIEKQVEKARASKTEISLNEFLAKVESEE